MAVEPTIATEWGPKRDDAGRFLPGQGGRKRGTKNKTSAATLAAVQEMASLTVLKLKEQVNSGNMRAIELVLTYVLPKGGRCIDLDGTADPHEIIEAMTNGEISPDEFARIAQGWKTAIDAADLSEIKRQVEELESIVVALRK
ncbi:hypothetical protein [Novosphingopyxis iocasae]|uniref:hypothetical protein n=1 Tax=Novosphingopyxis iocasae TaxID=2762729 RepID=UPI001650F4C8|nr:hypothetical protein [Novosphingopyxis iocasae]